MANKKPLLEARHITKIYEVDEPLQILSDVNLTLKEEETLAIMGRSGAGKSTLLHILGSLEKPTAGELLFQGKSYSKKELSSFRNQKIGFIFQSYNLLADFTVLDNVLIPKKIARENTKKGSLAYEKALQLLNQVGLLGRKDFLARVLSGGEKQRVAIARALINDPLLILADEPSGNVDSTHAADIHQLLLESAKKSKAALVIVTHDESLSQLCQKRLYLKNGCLQNI